MMASRADGMANACEGDLRRVSIDDGLAGDCVYCILKDSRGLTWVGTNNGLCLYDGRHVTTVSCDARRSLNLVQDLTELPDGSIVAAMRAGVFKLKIENGKLKNEKLELQRVCSSISDARSLLVEGDTLLVGSGDGLMMVLPQDGWRVQPLTLGSSRMARDNHIADLCADGQGGAWCISTSTLFHLDSSMKVRREEVDFSAVRDGLRCICAVDGKVYIGTSWQGLLCHDRATHRLQPVESVADGVVADLKTDGDGHLFVALDGAGALELDTRNDSIVRHYTSSTSLPSNAVYTFWREPQTGLSFFGFYRQGMAHSLYANPLVETYRHGTFNSRGLSVRSFCIHTPWVAVGTREGLWLVNEQTDAVRYFSGDEMGGANVLSIAWFAGQFVVATFDGGLCYIDPQTGRVRRPEEEMLRKGNFTKVGSLTPDPSPSLMAISDRVIILDESLHIQSQFDSRNSELSGAMLSDFLFDGSGKAWLSGTDGLALYDPANGIIQRTGFPAGFFNHELSMNFALDAQGDVLAVSENGLYRSRPDLSRWDSLDIAQRLDVATISFVAPQPEGYWVGTDRGLFLMDSLLVRFRHFGLAEGLPSLFCNPRNWQVDAAGNFWFSTDKGLHRVRSRRPSPRPPLEGGSGYLLTAEKKAAAQTHSTLPLEGERGGGILFFSDIKVDGRPLPLAECMRLSAQFTSVARLSPSGERGEGFPIGWNFGQEPIEISAMPLDYADGRACYLEWNVDDGPMQVTNDRRPIRITGLWLGRHKLHIYRPGDDVPQTITLSVCPNRAFCFEVLFVLLLLVSIPLLIQYQRRVARARALRRRKRALEMELHAQEAVKRHIAEEEQRRQEAEEARRAAMYQRSRSSQEEYRRLLRELKRLMEDERPYRQADLRVADVAKALGSTPNKVSQMLSQHAEVTFYDFINDYRIEEFKRRALDDKFAHLSTLAIAEMCGFKKTTFYAAFAKKEGCTPAEWLARQGKKR